MARESLEEIAVIMESNHGLGGGSESSDPDDWSESGDDNGSEYWEPYCGGPEDSLLDDPEEIIAQQEAEEIADEEE